MQFDRGSIFRSPMHQIFISSKNAIFEVKNRKFPTQIGYEGDYWRSNRTLSTIYVLFIQKIHSKNPNIRLSAKTYSNQFCKIKV